MTPRPIRPSHTLLCLFASLLAFCVHADEGFRADLAPDTELLSFA